LGIGPNPQSPIPQSPIPNPQNYFKLMFLSDYFKNKIYKIINIKNVD